MFGMVTVQRHTVHLEDLPIRVVLRGCLAYCHFVVEGCLVRLDSCTPGLATCTDLRQKGDDREVVLTHAFGIWRPQNPAVRLWDVRDALELVSPDGNIPLDLLH